MKVLSFSNDIVKDEHLLYREERFFYAVAIEDVHQND